MEWGVYMANNVDSEIDRLAVNIPKNLLIKRVKSLDPTFTSRSKKGYLEKFKQLSPDDYKTQASYYSAIRESRLFIYKVKDKEFEKLPVNELLKKLGPNKYPSTKGEVYEVKGSFPDNEKGFIFFSLKIHSDIKKFKKERPHMDGYYDLDYRDNRTSTVFYHYKSGYFELRTSSEEKAKLTSDFISNHIIKKPDSLFRRSLIYEEKKKLSEGTTNLELVTIIFPKPFQGCRKMTLEGDNLEATLEFFKNREIDLKELSSNNISTSIISSGNQNFKFYENGKITVKKKIKDPFGEILKALNGQNE